MKLTICGGRLIDPAQQIDEQIDIHIADGRVLALGQAPAGFNPERTIHAEGLVVTPGFIDIGAHLREPGPSYKGNLRSETKAALAGGYTTICCRPDTSPCIDSSAVVQQIQDKVELLSQAKVMPIGALTQGLKGTHLSNMAGLQHTGCVAVSNMRQPIESSLVLRRCLEYASTFDLQVVFYPEDHWLKADGCANEGALASRLGLGGIPASAEAIGLSRVLHLIETTGVKAHFGMLSTARAVEMVSNAQKRGLPVTADVDIAHLIYTEAEIDGYNSQFYVEPPLRSATDRDALRQGVKDGVLSVISSAHLPHEEAAKMAPFAAAEPGMATLETTLSQGLVLVEEGLLTLPQLIERLTDGPAKALGLSVGGLSVGQPADLCLFDAGIEWQVTHDSLFTAGENTPLMGQSVKGQVQFAIVDGEVAFERA
ncbi:dihydroorotase [Oceanospirillum beijerinckii]|uniref:dihydroorotase n=1 Tax=Oceanospirillum beijerinckii TaxID=64976 RepID=UPI000409DF34|nr:dihydroorotase [Oceanospirillum beijerinckii]